MHKAWHPTQRSGILSRPLSMPPLLPWCSWPVLQLHCTKRNGLPNIPFTTLNWFVFTDMSFAALFTIEAGIKVIADGFFWTPNAYFRSSWGFIDGIVLVTLWINVITSLYDPGGGSRAVGAFKALRALRLLNVSDSARDTFHSVIILGGVKVVSAAFCLFEFAHPFRHLWPQPVRWSNAGMQ